VGWAACSIAIGIFVVHVVIPAARNPATVGFTTCYAESRIVLESPRDLGRIYDDAWFQARIDGFLGQHVPEIAHAQPPTMSLIMLPVAWLPPAQARIAWIWMSLLFWVVGLAALADALHLPSVLGVPSAVWLTAASTAFRPIVENLRRGQGYALLFCLIALAVHSLLRTSRRRWWQAGASLGLALVLKSAGVWIYPLLAVARQWRILAGAAIAALVVVIASSTFMGWRIWPIYLADGFRFLALEPSNHVAAYQTLRSLTGHLFIYDGTWNAAPVAHLPALAKALNVLILGTAFVISARLERLDAEGLEERALTIALFDALIVPAAPIGEGYHYVLIFPAVVIAWWWAVRARADLRSRLALAACTALLLVPQAIYGSPRLSGGWTALLAYPLLCGAFGLWVWLGLALRRCPRGAQAEGQQRAGGQRHLREPRREGRAPAPVPGYDGQVGA
jgi:hypothetical protein